MVVARGSPGVKSDSFRGVRKAHSSGNRRTNLPYRRWFLAHLGRARLVEPQPGVPERRGSFDRLRAPNRGFCASGCLFFSAAFLVLIGAVVWGALSTYQGAYQMTSPQPRKFEPPPSASEENAFRLKLEALRDAVQKGDEAEFRFSANDLNAWLFANGRNSDLADHVRFRTEADWLVAEVSVPLSFMSEIPLLPSLRTRFFNGRVAARLRVENGELKVENLDVEGNGKRLAWLFTGAPYKQSISNALQKGIRARLPEGDVVLSRLESIRIENNDIVVKFKAA
jgi:hypothetical protein